MSSEIHCLTPPSGLKIFLQGPPLKEGPLPSLFYFALSGKDSLTLPPYNQPAVDLSQERMRIFSFSLPYHGGEFDPKDAIKHWIDAFHTHPQFLREFLYQAKENIDFLIREGWTHPEKMAAAGLSRGGLIAGHLAALEPRIQTILGFAPLISLDKLLEFQSIIDTQEIQILSLHSIIDLLVGKNLRFYVGNRDERISTDACYKFIRHLTERTYEKGYRTAQVELIISPSVGYKGHGTLPPIFNQGAEWIKTRLLG